jgi:hypothetical protein
MSTKQNTSDIEFLKARLNVLEDTLNQVVVAYNQMAQVIAKAVEDDTAEKINGEH